MVPEKAIRFFEKYNLDYIPVNHEGFYSTKEELKTSMLKLFQKITSGSLREFEEGSIVMLILRDSQNPVLDKVLSCSKIKTIEYKIFKKLKEKLKRFWDQYEDCSFFNKKMEKEYKNKYDRFKTEVNEIFKSNSQPSPGTGKLPSLSDLIL
jgi:hypothetical protein